MPFKVGAISHQTGKEEETGSKLQEGADVWHFIFFCALGLDL